MTSVATERRGVLQICDTLTAGGMERVAVNVANGLPRGRYDSHLCTTRSDGPLESDLAADVGRLRLRRRHTLDLDGLRRLVAYIRTHDIGILHAHGPSLFVASAAASFAPHPAIVWHDHFGAHETEERKPWLYRVPARRARYVIAVSEPLAAWAIRKLGCSPERVKFIQNFVAEPPPGLVAPPLPGKEGMRVVCVANLRPQKDHPNLLEAMRRVLNALPEAHLLLVGNSVDASHTARVQKAMAGEGLAGHVTWLGPRQDVQNILRGCTVGVLGSASEGLPLALIEYGMAGLPAVATRVGQCAEVLDDGHTGILVPPADPEALADAILRLLRSHDIRVSLAAAFAHRVREKYSVGRNLQQICDLYDTV